MALLGYGGIAVMGASRSDSRLNPFHVMRVLDIGLHEFAPGLNTLILALAGLESRLPRQSPASAQPLMVERARRLDFRFGYKSGRTSGLSK